MNDQNLWAKRMCICLPSYDRKKSAHKTFCKSPWTIWMGPCRAYNIFLISAAFYCLIISLLTEVRSLLLLWLSWNNHTSDILMKMLVIWETQPSILFLIFHRVVTNWLHKSHCRRFVPLKINFHLFSLESFDLIHSNAKPFYANPQ